MTKIIKMLIPLRGISKGTRKPTVETEGFVGAECQSASAAFEQALGASENEEIKDEMYHTEERREFLQEGGNGPSST